jgi:hypothetical protein
VRYEVPLATLSLGWVAVGYLAAEEYFRVRWGRNGCLITGLVVIVFSVGTVPKTLEAIGRDKFYLREGGAYLKQKPGNPVILTTDGRLGFYAAGQNQIRVKEKGNLPVLPEIREANYVALDGGTLVKLESVLNDNGFVLDREFLSKGHKDKLLIFRRSNS